MNNFFDKNDVLTVLTREQVKVGDKGYFGSNLKDLDTNIKCGEAHSLVKIYNEDSILYPFEGDHTVRHFALFLPADKVKNKEPSYRPLKNIDELFCFLTPDFEIKNNEKSNRYKKVETLLRRKITIRRKEDNFIKVMVITDIYFYGNDDNNDIYLNGDLLKYLFYKYEIQKNGEFVPFGILEE